jgi:hypothetical protein
MRGISVVNRVIEFDNMKMVWGQINFRLSSLG